MGYPPENRRQVTSPLDVTRAALATAALDLASAPPVPPEVGPITLHPHQHVAVIRLRRALDTHRGALLADAVGLGKTWVALALARDALRHDPAPVLVVAPAALRGMWRDAAGAAGTPITFASTEALSAPAAPRLPTAPALIVVDEAHHFRTPTTRRRERLASACAHTRTRTLLLSATPVHNSPHDLTALLALFLGQRAHALDAATLAYLVVRRRHADLRAPSATPALTAAPPQPRVDRTRWRHLPAAPAVRHALLTLPPPVPAADGAAAPPLATLTLVRLWTSSDAALRAALRRRLARAAALAHALAAGYHLDRRTLARWAAHDDAIQLPLFLDGDAHPDPRALAAHVDAHAAALRRTLATLDAAPPADPARIAWLRAVRDAHPGARVVAFTQFADTARAFYHALAPDGHVALLTAAGGRIASGPLARDALLRRFGLATDGPLPRSIERIDLLVTTDCLSEGLDLRAASVVTHLDVPWTPARLAQRVGRAARLGAPHATIRVHGLRPDPATDRWLRLARRLHRKARAARRALGASGPTDVARDHLAHHVAAFRLCERWLAHTPAATPHRAPVAAVHCGRDGLVAVWAPANADPTDRRPPTLVAALGARRPTTAPRTVARALRYLAGPDARAAPAPPTPLVAAARGAVRAWARQHAAAAVVGIAPPAAFDTPAPSAPAAIRAALARTDAALRFAPPHARAARADAVARLRAALAHPVGAAAERALAAAAHLAGDDAWLAAAHAAVADPARADAPVPAMRAPPAGRIAALVLLLP